MAKKAALLTVHGMGRTEPNYADGFQAEIARRLGASFDDLYFDSIFYQDILQKNEDEFWGKVRQDVGWDGIREFILFGFADATGLESNKDLPNSTYTQTQQVIAGKLLGAFAEVGEQGALVIIAHSLGCQVISNYLWDAQQPAVRAGIWKRPPASPSFKPQAASSSVSTAQLSFLKGGNLRALYTTGCNIPIFVAAHSLVRPIPQPNAVFEWHNFYDRDDVLGWPLGNLYTPRPSFLTDHDINVGGSLSEKLTKSWNPASHFQYWVSETVLDPLMALLRSLL